MFILLVFCLGWGKGIFAMSLSFVYSKKHSNSKLKISYYDLDYRLSFHPTLLNTIFSPNFQNPYIPQNNLYKQKNNPYKKYF